MNYIKAIFVILFVLLVIIISVQNYSSMSTAVHFRIDLGFFGYESPPMTLYLIAIITFLIGVGFTSIVGISERFRLKKQVKKLKKEAQEKDAELNSLRNLPLTSEGFSPAVERKTPEIEYPSSPREEDRLAEEDSSEYGKQQAAAENDENEAKSSGA